LSESRFRCLKCVHLVRELQRKSLDRQSQDINKIGQAKLVSNFYQ